MDSATEATRSRAASLTQAGNTPAFAKQPQEGELGVEPGMVSSSGLYTRHGQSISCSSLAQLSEQQQDKSDRMSRSLTCLGLAGSIPEGTEGEEEGGSIQMASTAAAAHHHPSRSVNDLSAVGFGQDEDVFNTGFEMDTGLGGVDRTSPFKVSLTPSRTIIVGNVPSAAADEHLKALFQAYGDIQMLRTEYKAHGVVVVAFYDIRAALNTKRQLEGVTLSNQPLTIHFSASGTMLGSFGEGTLLIFKVDPQAESQDLARVFSAYGDVRRVQDVPDKKNHKLIEFYDIRHANAAMAAINKAVAAGSKPEGAGIRHVASHANIGHQYNAESQEPSTLPGGADDNNTPLLMKSCIAAVEKENATTAAGSPKAQYASTGSSVSGMTKSISAGSGLADLATIGGQQNQAAVSVAPLAPGIAGGALPLTAQLAKGLQISDSATSLGARGIGPGGGIMQQPQNGLAPGSLDQYAPLGLSQQAGLMGYSSTGVQPLHPAMFGMNPVAMQGLNDRFGGRGPPPGFGGAGISRSLSSSISVGSGLDSMGQTNSAWNAALSTLNQANMAGIGSSNQVAGLGMGPSGMQHLAGTNLGQNVWAPSAGMYQGHSNIPLQPPGNANIYEAISKLQQAGVTNIPALLAQVGQNSSCNAQNNMWNQHTLANNAAAVVQQAIGTSVLSSLVSPGVSSAPEMGNMSKSASSPALSLVTDENREQRESHKSGGRLSRRNVDPVLEAERRTQQQKLYALDLEKVTNGEDKRTTLMIKNIPNKYTQKMLLTSVDEVLRGKFDFFYLPIDFKNKCNVGYGFINVMDPIHIIPLMEKFHNKKWERFNSEKVCCVTYARIQGKAGLVNHFQNSSLMHEDKKHRPVLFYSDGPQFGEAEPFPVGPNVRPRITFKDRDFRSRERSGYWS